MQEKYTENIDQLDPFYKDAFQDASIEPPAFMWDKISTSYAEQKKPKSIFSKRTLLLLLLLLLFVSVVGTVIYTKQKTQNTEQKEGTGTENSEQKSPEQNQETETVNSEQNKSQNAKQKTQNPKDNKEIGTVNSEEKTTTEEASPVVVETTPIIEDKKPIIDSTSLPKETPKKKQSFREKHTQNIKADSLRPLFVPVK